MDQKLLKQLLIEKRAEALHAWITGQVPLDTVSCPLFMLDSGPSSNEPSKQQHQPIGG